MYIQTDMHQFYGNLIRANDKNPYKKALSRFRFWNVSNSTVLQEVLSKWGWEMW